LFRKKEGFNNKKDINMLTYKGYTGSVHYSAADNVFFGKVEGVNDLITFEGETEQELKNAFRYMIDEHIKDCKKENCYETDNFFAT
jgi:predicted HicB family RNase H-like nuclease